ncbi:MAG: hypothetical protein ABI689_12500 [Thermoanaerobaculia bacterium]
MPLAAGFVLGPYEILAPLGAGGMGEVYRALDRRLEREVAINHPNIPLALVSCAARRDTLESWKDWVSTECNPSC